jgi:hypothetical protein
MNKLIFYTRLFIFATIFQMNIAEISYAQTYPFVTDSTGNVPLRGDPQLKCSSPVTRTLCEAMTLQIQGQGGGATMLPYAGSLPPNTGHYNNANFPLFVSAVAYGRSSAIGVVDGQTVAVQTISDGGSHAAISFVVPPKASFYFSQGAISVMAMANNANWQATGIRYAVGATYYSTSASVSSRLAYSCVGYSYSADSNYVSYTSNTSNCAPYPSDVYYAYNAGSFTENLTTCSWTSYGADNWGATNTTGTGAIQEWPSIPCDSANVSHYYAGTGPFTPPPPPYDGGSGNN